MKMGNIGPSPSRGGGVGHDPEGGQGRRPPMVRPATRATPLRSVAGPPPPRGGEGTPSRRRQRSWAIYRGIGHAGGAAPEGMKMGPVGKWPVRTLMHELEGESGSANWWHPRLFAPLVGSTWMKLCSKQFAR